MNAFRSKQLAALELTSTLEAKREQSLAKNATTTTTTTTNRPAISSSTADIFSEMTNSVQKRSKKAADNLLPIVKSVIDYLSSERREHTRDEILDKVKVAEKTQDKLFTNLRDNVKIVYNPLGASGKGTYAYKIQFGKVKSIEDMISTLKEDKYKLKGIDINDLKDAYKGSVEDLNQLQKERKVMIIKNTDTKSDVVFYLEPTNAPILSDSVKNLWTSLAGSMPRADDMDADLEKMGLKPFKSIKWAQDDENLKRKREMEEEENSKKKKRQRKNAKKTNTHLDDADM